ncbi:MAG: hypothetical protein HS103_11805 [Anaerolineales bacterium]|nr:hypothetical protein [Anaerolineales bacterium]
MTALPRTLKTISVPTRETLPALPDVASAPTLPEGFAVYDGRLIHRGLDLMRLAETPMPYQGTLVKPTTPLYIRRVEALRNNLHALQDWFAEAARDLDYPGSLTVAFASKANPAAPVAKTLLQAGAAYECSSASDVQIVQHAAAQGWLDRSRTILANGFKIPVYANALIGLRAAGFAHVLPIFDDLEEIEPFAESGLPFEVGLRSRTDSDHANRFGLSLPDMLTAATCIAATGTLRLTTFHAMQTVSASKGLPYQSALVNSLRRYAALRRHAPTLHRFNFGGGLPGRTSGMDFEDWLYRTLGTILAVCREEGIPAPDVIFECGRYLVQNHASRLFRIVKTRMGEDGIPYYMVDGSIMSSFPDAWALGDAFTVLPVNNWDGAFIPARLAGLTCDHDDVYPTRKMDDIPLLLPANARGLVVGFFDCGAYQETLGGRGGAKHCLLSEGSEVILDEDSGAFEVEHYAPPQSVTHMLANMGYGV